MHYMLWYHAIGAVVIAAWVAFMMHRLLKGKVTFASLLWICFPPVLWVMVGAIVTITGMK